MSAIAPTVYTVYPDGYSELVHSDKYLWTITVELTDSDKGTWAVRRLGTCANRRGEFDYEPYPSSRTGRWLKSHRFPLHEALSIAHRAVEVLIVNGTTARQASDHVAARNRGE